jgi:hypothetical protein
MSYPLATSAAGACYGGLRPAYDPTIDRVERSWLDLVRNLRQLIDEIDTKERSNWPYVIQAALDAGVTDDDLRRELGTSPSTVYRWMSEDVAPREGTRRLMKGALLRLLDARIEAINEELSQREAIDA